MTTCRILSTALLLLLVPRVFARTENNTPGAVAGLQYLEDDTGTWSLQQVKEKFEAGEGGDIRGYQVKLGFSEHDYWFRLLLHGDTRDERRVLSISNPRLGLVTLFAPDDAHGGNGTSAGVRAPFWKRENLGLSPAFSVQIPAGATKLVYLRVRNYGALQFGIRLWSPEAYHKHADYMLALALVVAGALLLLALHNLFVFAHLRQTGYLWLGLFFICCTLRQMTASGTANMFFWPNAALWARYAMTFTGVLTLVVGTFMANCLLQLNRYAPRMARLNIGLGFLAVAASILSLGSTTLVYVMLASSLAIPVSVTGGAILTWRRGSDNALAFLSSWGFVLAGSLATNLARPLGIPSMVPAEYFLDFGLLAGGLGWSYNLTRQVKLRHQKQQRQLEVRVEERTAALGEALETVRTLRGLLPICSCCKKIRNDQGYWQHVEHFLQAHTDADFSHGLCPECAVEHYPEYFPVRGGPMLDKNGEG